MTEVNIPADALACLLVYQVSPLTDDDEPLDPEILVAWLSLRIDAPEIAEAAGRDLAEVDREQVERINRALAELHETANASRTETPQPVGEHP